MKKLKPFTNMIILIFFGICLLFFAINSIIQMFKKTTQEEVVSKINYDNIDENIINIEDATAEKKSNIVKDYKTFYTLENACKNFFSFFVDGKYAKTHSILVGNAKEVYKDKADYEKKCKELVEKKLFDGMDIENGFDNTNVLLEAYDLSNNLYLCKINGTRTETLRIGLMLNEKEKTYKVFYFEM